MKNLDGDINKFQLLYETGENDIADGIVETLGFSDSNDLIYYLKELLGAMGEGDVLLEEETNFLNVFTEILTGSTSSVTISTADKDFREGLFKMGKKVCKLNDADWFIPKHVFEDLRESVSAYSDFFGSRTVQIQKGKIVLDKTSALEYSSVDHDPVGKQYLILRDKIIDYAKLYNVEEHSDIHVCLTKLYHKVSTLDPDSCNQQNAVVVAELLQSFKIKMTENSHNIHDEGRYVVNFADMKFDKSILNTQDGLKLLEYVAKHYGKEAYDLLLDFDNEDISQILGEISTQGYKPIMDMLMGRDDDNVVTHDIDRPSDAYLKPEESSFAEVLGGFQDMLNSGVIYVKTANTFVSGLRFANSPSAAKAWKLGGDALQIYNLKCGFGPYSQMVKVSEIGCYIYNGEYSKAFSAASSTAFFLMLPGMLSAVHPVLGVIYTGGILGSSLYSLRNDCTDLIEEYRDVNAVQSINRSDSNPDLKMKAAIIFDDKQVPEYYISPVIGAEEIVLDPVECGLCRGVEVSNF